MDRPTIDMFAVCEYATVDVDGKSILGGVYNEEIVFPEGTANWNSVKFFIVLRPVIKNFSFSFVFTDPNKRTVFTLEGTFEGSETPNLHDFVKMNIPLPANPPLIAGTYNASFLVDGQRAYSKELIVRVGGTARLFQPKITAEIKLGT